MSLGIEQAIAERLKADGFGNLYSDPADKVIYIGEEPPDAPTITVLITGGPPPLNIIMETHQIQIIVRNASHETAWQTSREIRDALHELQAVLKGIRISRITSLAPPSGLGRLQSGVVRVGQLFNVRSGPVTFS